MEDASGLLRSDDRVVDRARDPVHPGAYYWRLMLAESWRIAPLAVFALVVACSI